MTNHMLELVRGMFEGEAGSVLELGSYIEANQDHMNVRGCFPRGTRYVGVDVNAGNGVDVVADFLDLELAFELRPRIILCLYVIEHVWDIRRAALALSALWNRNPESWLLVATHQNQPFHGTDKYGDFWRLTMPGLARLMDEAGVPETKIFGLDDWSNPEDIIAVRQPASSPWPWPPGGPAQKFLTRWKQYR